MSAIQIWARMSKGRRIASTTVLALIAVLCVNGVAVLGASVGPAPQRTPETVSTATGWRAQVTQVPRRGCH
jgi:hypothetical protein